MIVEVCANSYESVLNAQKAGADRILISGQKPTAVQGIELLKMFNNLVNKKITIMPGGGINESNKLEFKNAGFKELHFSATKLHRTIELPKVL